MSRSLFKLLLTLLLVALCAFGCAMFLVVFDGKVAGSATVPPGTVAEVVDIHADNVGIAYHGGGHRVAIDATDLRQRVAAEMTKAAEEAKNPASAAPMQVESSDSAEPVAPNTPSGPATAPCDEIVFGDAASEGKHELKADHSEIAQGALDLPARKLLPGGPEPWEGGKVSFTMKVDPNSPTYFTVKFWGGEASKNRLVLYCEGEQIGYRHLGDIDMLDIGETEEPPYNGRFFYVTTPLPLKMTKGKSELHFEIHSLGAIFAYATKFEDWQRPMDGPARGMYGAYTHVDPCLIPPAAEKQGTEPPAPRRRGPGDEVLKEMKEHIAGYIDKLFASDTPLNQSEALMLARAYHIKWSPAYHDREAADQVIKSVDELYSNWKVNEQTMLEDKNTENPGWFAAGPAAEAVQLLAEPIEPSLDQPLGSENRRAEWLALFERSRDWLRTHRRLYTNQSMIVDLNIYRSNRALEALDASKAMPEEKALHYLYESVGLLPWLGSDTDHGPEKPMGDNYFQITEKGLTKELGYVGNYGEVLDWLSQIYDATRPEPGMPGDEKIKDQIIKIFRARAAFRYPMPDEEGNRAMRLETIIGWRDHHYPGPVTYAEVARRDASPIRLAAATLDPQGVGYAQQMFADNQFFASLREMMKKSGLFEALGMLDTPSE